MSTQSSTQAVSLLQAYKNFAANQNISHIGLGVAALNNQKVLRSLGVKADVQPIVDVAALTASLEKQPRTHVVISAPWIPTRDLQRLTMTHPETQFFVNCHSNVGFLQADRNGVKLFREGIELECGSHNFHMAGNSRRFVDWVRNAYGAPCTYLPNLYYLNGFTPHAHVYLPSDGPLRIGCFGATRPLKNILSAAGAALEVARDLRRPLEFWLSAGRTEGGGDLIMSAVQNLIGGLPGVTLKLNGWQTWPNFRQLISTMHLLLQPSYTESFNMVTADGIAMGVPSVVSDAIDWAPDYWKADVDDVMDIARTGKLVLAHRNAAHDGMQALVAHNTHGAAAWGVALRASDLPAYKVAA